MEPDPEETIVITEMVDCPSVEMQMEVGDKMYMALVNYAKRNMTNEHYFKAGFNMMIEGYKLKKDHSGQLNFSFDTAE